MMRPINQSRERGMAAVAVIALMLLLGLVVMGMVHGTARDQSLTVSRVETIQAFYAAEAGVNMATRELAEDDDEDGDGAIGSISDDSNDATDPALGSGRVMVTVSESGGQYTLTSQGRSGSSRREAVSLVAPGGNRLMFVVADSTSMTSQDLAKQTQFGAWGYTVTLIDDAEVQSNYDAAVAVNDVAYISEEVSSGSVNTKMKDSAIGIVSEEGYLTDEMGFSSGRDEYTETQIDITDNSHYITSPFSTGLLTISSATNSFTRATGTIAGGGQTLAEQPSSSDITMMVIETGGALDGGGTAAARRVLLPGGPNAFDFTDLNSDGLTIVQRAIQWVGGDFGFTTLFGSTQSAVNAIQIATQVTLSHSLDVNNITAYIGGGGPHDVRYAIYTDAAGEPDTLLAETATASSPGTGDWLTISLPTTTLSAGTYWLAVSLDKTNLTYTYDSSGGQTRYNGNDPIGSGYSASWGTSTNTSTRRISIYANGGMGTSEMKIASWQEVEP